MPVIDALLELEEQGWQALSSADPVQFCREWLADDAVMIIPGMVIDRATFLDAVAREQPWATHRIEEPRVVRLSDDLAALVYRVTAQRDDQPEFVGLLTSIYVNRAGRWHLALHQQTPLPAHVVAAIRVRSLARTPRSTDIRAVGRELGHTELAPTTV